jgi:hypothetical protein
LFVRGLERRIDPWGEISYSIYRMRGSVCFVTNTWALPF